MKYILLFTFIFSTQIFSLTFHSIKTDSTLYPGCEKLLIYTFANAEDFVNQKDYNKAIWIYINLFPVDSAKVIDGMNAIKSNFTKSIKMTVFDGFGLNWMCDPEIWDGKGGVDGVNMKKKGKWADDLIMALEDEE